MLISTHYESQPYTKPVIVTHQFDDIDAYATAIKPLNLSINQLTPGLFVGNVYFADFNGIKFTYINHNQSIKATGLKSAHDLTFAIALPGNRTEILSDGFPIQKWDLFGFNPTTKVDLTTSKNAYIVLANVNLTVFYSLAEQMGYPDLGKNILQQNLLRFHPASLRNLRVYYQQISQILSTQPSLLTQSKVQSQIIEKFLPLLIDTLGKTIRKKKSENQNFRPLPSSEKSGRNCSILH